MRLARAPIFSVEIKNLTQVLAPLPVVLLQLQDAVLQPAHIRHHATDFGMNEVGGRAHAGILEGSAASPGSPASGARGDTMTTRAR